MTDIDSASPKDLVTGQVIKDKDGKDNRVDAVHKNADGDILQAELTRLYDGHTTLQDPSEDVSHPPVDDTDTAREVGQPSRSGRQGPTRVPGIARKDMSAEELNARLDVLESAIVSLSARVLKRTDLDYVDDVDMSGGGDDIEEPDDSGDSLLDDGDGNDDMFDEEDDPLVDDSLDDTGGSIDDEMDFSARAQLIYKRVAFGDSPGHEFHGNQWTAADAGEHQEKISAQVEKNLADKADPTRGLDKIHAEGMSRLDIKKGDVVGTRDGRIKVSEVHSTYVKGRPEGAKGGRAISANPATITSARRGMGDTEMHRHLKVDHGIFDKIDHAGRTAMNDAHEASHYEAGKYASHTH